MKISALLVVTNGFVYHDNSPVQNMEHVQQRDQISDLEMKEIFAKRKEKLVNFCKNNHPKQQFKPWDERPSHIYVADVDLGLLGCAPLKAGSSTWKAWWWYHLTPDINHDGKSVPGHQPRIARIPVQDGEDLLNNSNKIRFLVVRHPLLRFYSGWHQKLAKRDPTSAKILSKSDKLASLSLHNMNNGTEPMTVNFADFADFYGAKPWPHINPHFDSVASHCDICSFKYDYIIKAETMNDEANYILRQTGLDIKPEDGFMHRNSQLTDDSRITHDVLKPLLENIEPNIIKNLQERYKEDYEAFGYDIDYDSLTLLGW